MTNARASRPVAALPATHQWPIAMPTSAHASWGISVKCAIGRWPPMYDVSGFGSQSGKYAGPTIGPSASTTAMASKVTTI